MLTLGSRRTSTRPQRVAKTRPLRRPSLWLVLAQLAPSCSQEYKWRELEEQRQAQKLQRQLQQEQAYLLSLQKSPHPDASEASRQQSSSLPHSLEHHKIKPPHSPQPDAAKQPQGTDLTGTGSGQSPGLEKTRGRRGSAPALALQPIREVTPRSSNRPL